MWVIYMFIGLMPWAFFMVPLIEYYNWQRPRNNRLVDILLRIQNITIWIQILGLTLFVYEGLKFIGIDLWLYLNRFIEITTTIF
jgi:hypothetical protein